MHRKKGTFSLDSKNQDGETYITKSTVVGSEGMASIDTVTSTFGELNIHSVSSKASPEEQSAAVQKMLEQISKRNKKPISTSRIYSQLGTVPIIDETKKQEPPKHVLTGSVHIVDAPISGNSFSLQTKGGKTTITGLKTESQDKETLPASSYSPASPKK